MGSERWYHLLLVVAGWISVASHADAAISLRVNSNVPLPGNVIARDVRWAGPLEVYVSLGKQGAIRTRVDSTAHPTTVMPPADRGGFVLSGRIAAGQRSIS
jgi:hypothetical protein